MNTRNDVRTLPRRSLRALSAVATSLVAISACGSSSSGNGEAKKTGPQVASDAAAALKSAGSAHLKGTQTDGTNTATIDLVLVTNGATGTITQAGIVVHQHRRK